MAGSDIQSARGWLRQLRTAVETLAADPPTQERWLIEAFVGQRGVVVDEIALVFEDAWMDGEVMHAPTLSSAARERLEALDRALSAMSGGEHAELWTVDALRSRPEWVQVRALAEKALAALAT